MRRVQATMVNFAKREWLWKRLGRAYISAGAILVILSVLLLSPKYWPFRSHPETCHKYSTALAQQCDFTLPDAWATGSSKTR